MEKKELLKHLLELLELDQSDEALVKEFLNNNTITQLFNSYLSLDLSLSCRKKIGAVKILAENYR